MNAAFECITPNKSFPWFDEYSRRNTFCKVYNDGSCYIAIPTAKGVTAKKPRNYYPTLKDDLFDHFYFEALKQTLSGEDLVEYIVAGIKEYYPNDWTIREFVIKKLDRVKRNLWARKKRFRRKAFLNPWNYFVSFTYDDKLQDEESFRKRIKKCLSNLHSRRGWMYMGVFERGSDTGRLHFHAILYVPDGQMVGDIYERRDYSTKQHKMQITHPNTFFERTFGRNDFEPLSSAELRRGTTMQYLLKYLEKTEERIIYSRGIPTEFYKMVNDDDVICEMLDFVTKYILFNDVIDYETDVKLAKSTTRILNLEPLPS